MREKIHKKIGDDERGRDAKFASFFTESYENGRGRSPFCKVQMQNLACSADE
jgi:hypothetical protein